MRFIELSVSFHPNKLILGPLFDAFRGYRRAMEHLMLFLLELILRDGKLLFFSGVNISACACFLSAA